MRKSLSISIPKPCHENWDAMTPKEQGRHCQVCERTVIDFTNKTDEQIVKTYQRNTNLCGRFRSQQLDREMVLRQNDRNNFASIAASGLLAFLALGTHEAVAQVQPQIVNTNPVKHESIKGKVATSILKEKVITGIIVDEDGLPLPGVNVIVKGTTKGVQTDFDGHYTIKVKVEDTLTFSYLGFKTKEVKVTNRSELNIMLEYSNDELLGVVVVGMLVANPDNKPSYVYSPEGLEEKKQREFREQNGLKFYKRKKREKRDSIRNNRALKKEMRQAKNLKKDNR